MKFYNSVDGYGFIRSGSQSRPGAPEVGLGGGEMGTEQVYQTRSRCQRGPLLQRGLSAFLLKLKNSRGSRSGAVSQRLPIDASDSIEPVVKNR